MEIRKQIERFRSEALMSRYDKAIDLGNNILSKLKLIQNTFHQDFSQLKQQLKQQINFCVQLQKSMTSNHSSQYQNKPLLVQQKQQDATQYKPKSKSTWKKNKIHQQHLNQQMTQIKSQKDIIVHSDTNENQTIEQKLYKHLILPLNMPLFKLKNSLHLIITQNCLTEVIEYLNEYDFKQFQNLQIQDLGVQNIVNAKIQMIEMNKNRGFIVVQNQNLSQHSIKQNKIAKLSKIIQAYKQFEKQQIKNKVVLVLLIQNHFNSQKSPSPLQSEQISYKEKDTKYQKQIFFY